ncbi:unnamed protein product [Acanthoscelides obtectus]|uniref:Elongation of very long chain fatty acids protein n=1 Tax=Acanthoscelides obtectus TaxID=200917 RepID=A0A9P0MBI4_ACAOB|nr:unnamed protein product [Acanthoscelides obtectus]CAK1621094.1 Elongation of very long chain fatty acids protein 7 [Acanthoscelides obtectus]
MALVLKKIYHLFLSAEELSDQRLKDAWVLGKPIQLLALTAIYLYFVKKLGPQLMEKRKPLEIKKIMMAYDILQVVLNAYVSWEALLSLLKGNWRCNAIDYSDDPFALRQLWIGKCYFWLKILDLLDTVQFLFFTLKFSQLFIQKDCMYPKIASILFVPQNLFMSALFMDFYLKSYVYKVKKS